MFLQLLSFGGKNFPLMLEIVSLTVSPFHMVSLILLTGVNIRACLNLHINGVRFTYKLTFEALVRNIISRLSQRIGRPMVLKIL